MHFWFKKKNVTRLTKKTGTKVVETLCSMNLLRPGQVIFGQKCFEEYGTTAVLEPVTASMWSRHSAAAAQLSGVANMVAMYALYAARTDTAWVVFRFVAGVCGIFHDIPYNRLGRTSYKYKTRISVSCRVLDI